MNIKQITKCAIFCALICVGALIKIPVPNIPITMQMFCVFLAAILLKPVEALFCVGVYIFLGLAGLPIFASGGGMGYVLNPSFGYILGFLPGVFFGAKSSVACDTKSSIIKSLVICLFLVYAVGISYFCVISRFVMGVDISFEYIIKICILLMLPGDVLSAFFAVVVAKRLKRSGVM